MAWHARNLERSVDSLAAVEEDVRLVRPQRDFGKPVGRVRQDRRLVARHVDLRACALGQVGDAAEVIPVRVRDQDPGTLGRKDFHVGAWINDDGLGSAAFPAHDVAVRPDRAELVSVDGEAHGPSLTASSAALRAG